MQWISIACEDGTLYVDDFVLPALGNDSGFTLKVGTPALGARISQCAVEECYEGC